MNYKYKVYVERIHKSSDVTKMFNDLESAINYAKHQPFGNSYIYELEGFNQKLVYTKLNRYQER